MSHPSPIRTPYSSNDRRNDSTRNHPLDPRNLLRIRDRARERVPVP